MEFCILPIIPHFYTGDDQDVSEEELVKARIYLECVLKKQKEEN